MKVVDLKSLIELRIFFTDNYDHAMFDGDIQLVDMVYLKNDLTAKAI